MFTDKQLAKLKGKLNPANVSQRNKGKTTLSYIEGWYAIAAANEIFGYDSWNRETISCECIAQSERKIGKGDYQRGGWGVSYNCRVRITVGDIIREGTGSGHGIDDDLGQAHESAIKEAETDAMKRALMTFGNKFGLALYDKKQRGVGVDAKDTSPVQKTGNKDIDKGLFDKAMADIQTANTVEVLKDAEYVWLQKLTDVGCTNDQIGIFTDQVGSKLIQLNDLKKD